MCGHARIQGHDLAQDRDLSGVEASRGCVQLWLRPTRTFHWRKTRHKTLPLPLLLPLTLERRVILEVAHLT
jgi:hypothetical protein